MNKHCFNLQQIEETISHYQEQYDKYVNLEQRRRQQEMITAVRNIGFLRDVALGVSPKQLAQTHGLTVKVIWQRIRESNGRVERFHKLKTMGVEL